jgi:hypothetical protein
MNGFLTWAFVTLVGTVTVLCAEILLRGEDAAHVEPISQGIGFLVAGILAYPLWVRYQPGHRFGFLGHACLIACIAAVMIAIRIRFRLG